MSGGMAVIMTLGTKRATDMNLIRQSVLGDGETYQNASRNYNLLFDGLENIQNVYLCDIATSDE
jgi:hypothetical protein